MEFDEFDNFNWPLELRVFEYEKKEIYIRAAQLNICLEDIVTPRDLMGLLDKENELRRQEEREFYSGAGGFIRSFFKVKFRSSNEFRISLLNDIIEKIKQENREYIEAVKQQIVDGLNLVDIQAKLEIIYPNGWLSNDWIIRITGYERKDGDDNA